MDIREYWLDIVLVIVMVISTLVLILRFWQDAIIAVSASLMIMALGGLFLSLEIKVRHLEKSVISREALLRSNLEEVSARMAEKYDLAVAHLDEVMGEYTRRMYK